MQRPLLSWKTVLSSSTECLTESAPSNEGDLPSRSPLLDGWTSLQSGKVYPFYFHLIDGNWDTVLSWSIHTSQLPMWSTFGIGTPRWCSPSDTSQRSSSVRQASPSRDDHRPTGNNRKNIREARPAVPFAHPKPYGLTSHDYKRPATLSLLQYRISPSDHIFPPKLKTTTNPTQRQDPRTPPPTARNQEAIMSGRGNGGATSAPGGARPASLDSTSSASADATLEEEPPRNVHKEEKSCSAPSSPSKVLGVGKNSSAARTPREQNTVSDVAGTSETVPGVAGTDETRSEQQPVAHTRSDNAAVIQEAAAADAQGEAAPAEMEQAMTGGLLDPSDKKMEPRKRPRDVATKCPSSDADPLHGGVMDDPVISPSASFTESSDHQVENDSMLDKSMIMGSARKTDPFEELFHHSKSLKDASVSESSGLKRQKMQNASDGVLKEIEAIRSTMVDTEITIAGDSGTYGITSSSNAGTTIQLSYTAVALSRDLKSLFASSEKITPAKLSVPSDYPRRSPMLITDEGDDRLRKKSNTISGSAHRAFRLALKDLPEPHSIKDIAKAWETCVRTAVIKFAEQYGGGTFSSKFGQWERCDGS